MQNWRDLTNEQFITEVADLRRQRTTWHDVAALLHTSTRTLARKVRPHLPPELNAPLSQARHNGKPTIRTRVDEYLDGQGDTESATIARELGICASTASYYRGVWRSRGEKPEPEPEARCPVCTLPLAEGLEVCELCLLQRHGIVLAYAVEDLPQILHELTLCRRPR